jgi:hypothetical protein
LPLHALHWPFGKMMLIKRLLNLLPLQSFKNEYPVSIEWKKSFNGENSLASFRPSFYSGNMLVADPEGNILSLNHRLERELEN